MEAGQLETTNRLLRAIIGLLVRRGDGNDLSVKEQIEVLSECGLGAADISAILGKSGSHVRKELSRSKKPKPRKKSK